MKRLPMRGHVPQMQPTDEMIGLRGDGSVTITSVGEWLKPHFPDDFGVCRCVDPECASCSGHGPHYHTLGNTP